MNILVIHPQDKSTDFLKTIYENLENVTLVRGGYTPYAINQMIKSHDQVMMMGHGSPHGLFTMGQFPGSLGYVINDDHAELLAEKDNSVFVWCNADQYVKYNELKGFYTGMFISDVTEARIMGMPFAQQGQVDESNDWFVNSMSRAANDDTDDLHSYVKHDYGELVHRNPVAKYNHERLYIAA